MKKTLYYNCLLRGVLLLLCWWLIVACTDRGDLSVPAVDKDAPVVICARVWNHGLATRTGEAEDPTIRNRELLFTYPTKPEGKMTSVRCQVDKDGYAYIMDAEGNPLEWDDIYTEGNDYALYLDNLLEFPVQEPNLNTYDPLKRFDNFERIHFGWDPDNLPTDNKNAAATNYKKMAAPITEPIAKELDILCGKIEKPKIGQLLQFTLQHMMAQLTFRLTSDEPELQERLKSPLSVTLKYAKTVIYKDNDWSLGTKGAAFSRKNQSIWENNTNIYGTNYWVIKALENAPLDDTGCTPTWILPPNTYEWSYAANRDFPFLVIDLGEEGTFEGQLPGIMHYTPVGGEQMEAKLGFWKGYHLQINVRLVSDTSQRQLIFERVEVGPWNREFEEKPELNESGIYTGDDLLNLIALYNANPNEGNYRLRKYGVWQGNEWVFRLWKDITIILPQGEEFQKFTNDNFKIIFRNDDKTYRLNINNEEITDSNYKNILADKQ